MKKTSLFLIFVFFNSLSYSQTVRTVCSSGCDFTTIQAAINGSSSGDIVKVNNTIHTEAGIIINKSITIRGNGISTTTVQAAATRQTATDKVFSIPNASITINVVFEDMLIRHGYAAFQQPNQFSFGGGLEIRNGTGSTYTFNRVSVSYNNTRTSTPDANGGGAGIYFSPQGAASPVYGTLYLNDCIFDDNNTGTATANSLGSGQQGGAISILSTANIYASNTTFSNNTCFTGGGALYLANSNSGSFTNCTFESNNVTEPSASGGSGNSFSGAGGAIFSRGGTYDYTNCTFNNNSSPSFGGAIALGGGTMTNCTFTGNSSDIGGAIFKNNRYLR